MNDITQQSVLTVSVATQTNQNSMSNSSNGQFLNRVVRGINYGLTHNALIDISERETRKEFDGGNYQMYDSGLQVVGSILGGVSAATSGLLLGHSVKGITLDVVAGLLVGAQLGHSYNKFVHNTVAKEVSQPAVNEHQEPPPAYSPVELPAYTA